MRKEEREEREEPINEVKREERRKIDREREEIEKKK